jgi:hypothetical protein
MDESEKFRNQFKATKLSEMLKSDITPNLEKEKSIFYNSIEEIIFTKENGEDKYHSIIATIKEEEKNNFFFELLTKIIEVFNNNFGLWDDYNNELNYHFNKDIDYQEWEISIEENKECFNIQATENWMERRTKELYKVIEVIKGLEGSTEKLLRDKVLKINKVVVLKPYHRFFITYKYKEREDEIIDSLYHYFVDNNLMKGVLSKQNFRNWFIKDSHVNPIYVDMQMNELFYLFDEIRNRGIINEYRVFAILERMFLVNNTQYKNFGRRRIISANSSDYREEIEESKENFKAILIFVKSI